MDTPIISVVTICYNAVECIEETMLSVLNQTYDKVEYIVIDGGSKDGTVDIIKRYAHRLAYWTSEPDKGIYAAMNKGIQKANGEWINFMNAGDTFYSSTVIQEVFSKVSLSSDIIYGDTCLSFSIGQYIREGKKVTDKDYMPFGHQASFSRTRLMKTYGFDTCYKVCADYKFFYQIYKIGGKFEYIDLIVSNYEAEAGLSSVNTSLLKYERGKIEGKASNIFWLLSCIVFYILSLLKRVMLYVLPTSIANLIKKSRYKKMFKPIQ